MNDTSGHPFAGSAIALSGVNLSLGSGAGRVHILRDIDLNIGRGEAIGLLGPSGSGKSTLLMVMTGLERPASGAVVVAGKNLQTLGEDELARFRGSHIGIVFQAFHLIPTMTALENVAVPLELAGARDAFLRAERELTAVSSRSARKKASRAPASSSGTATFSSAVIVGIKWKAWKTMPIWLPRKRASSSSPSVCRFFPATTTAPLAGRSSPVITMSSVDLPEPDGPRRPIASPRPIFRSMSRRI